MAEATDGLTAAHATETFQPTLLFLDLNLPRLHGLEVLKQVRNSSPRTAETHRSNLMRELSMQSQTDLVRFAIRKGLITA